MKISAVCLLMWCLSNFGFGSHSVKHQTHHMFNTAILQPGEHQVSVYGNYKLGISEDLEVGTQGLLSLVVPNFYLRHKMFEVNGIRTTFSSHMFYSNSVDYKSLSGYFNVNVGFLESESTVLSVGLIDFFMAGVEGSFFKDDLSISHTYVPTVSWDVYFNKSWLFNGILALPLYATIEQRSEYGETDGEIIFPMISDTRFLGYMATFIYSASGTFNMEFGFMGMSDGTFFVPVPYLNLFWRFGA